MANEYVIHKADLTAVAEAIRTKGGTSDALEFPGGFVDAVGTIQTGGGSTGLIIGNVNLHDPSAIVENHYVNHLGAEIAYNNWSISNYIPVKPNTWYYTTQGSNYREYCFYDENKAVSSELGKPISSAQGKSSLGLFKTNDSTHFIRFSGTTANIKAMSIYECIGEITFLEEGEASTVNDYGISETMALDILTGGGPEEA